VTRRNRIAHIITAVCWTGIAAMAVTACAAKPAAPEAPSAPAVTPQVKTKEAPSKLKTGDRCTTAYGPGTWSAEEGDCWLDIVAPAAVACFPAPLGDCTTLEV
jgi:hypothetical protein